MNHYDFARLVTQTAHRVRKRDYYRDSGSCTCTVRLPADKDGRCLICRRPQYGETA